MWEKFKKVRAKLSWAFGGNLVYSLSQWLIVTIIARFGSAEDLGVYSLGLALTAPIVLFFSFQLRAILATDTKNEFNFGQYFGGRIIHVTISFIVISLVAIIYANDIITILLILLIGLLKYFEALSDICMGYFQKEGRIDLIGKSQFYRGILSAFIVGLLYSSTKSILITVLGLLFVMITRLILYDIKHLKPYIRVLLIFDKSSFRLMKLALPLGATSLITSLNTNIPRYLLDYFSGIKEVGVFSALYYVLIASNMLITPISLLMAPKIAKTFNKKGRKAFLKLNVQLLIVAVLASLVIIVPIIFQGEFILSILYGNKYAIYNETFLVISFSLLFGFINAFLSLSTIAARKIKIQPLINLIVTCITLFTGFYFIKLYGLQGAAYSLLISRVIQTILYLGLLLYILRKKGLDDSFA